MMVTTDINGIDVLTYGCGNNSTGTRPTRPRLSFSPSDRIVVVFSLMSSCAHVPLEHERRLDRIAATPLGRDLLPLLRAHRVHI